jgi:hypothetical protein
MFDKFSGSSVIALCCNCTYSTLHASLLIIDDPELANTQVTLYSKDPEQKANVILPNDSGLLTDVTLEIVP